ncbi:hypothetical protein BJV74DRAFT_839399 [Russula compacta]|nr:hypothetical protein BJV74DRAFT_839399 [Russula compacta]
MNTNRSEPDDTATYTPTKPGQGRAQIHSLGVNYPPDQESEAKPMTGDFDSSADALWTIYGKEARNHDKIKIESLKDHMDSVFLFAGLFSAALTPFIVDSKQSLKVNPTDQIVYYLQQNVAITAQISRQLSSIAPQVAIPSTPPSPFPPFNPAASDVIVNVFWFMALFFSLAAAILALHVQRWVRNYMHISQSHSDPLKSARIRQYLYEGWVGQYTPAVAEAIPSLLNMAVFLFFVGLCDYVLNINTTVGLSTTVPIGVSCLVYILIMFAPIIYPRSPYQNSFSGFIWYLIQKLGGRRYKDQRYNGALKPVSTILAEGQMQLAMEETEERKGRDGRAIGWLVGNSTEDAELESFVMAIPGSFGGEWGVEVWKNVSKMIEDENKSRNWNRRVEPVTDTNVSAAVPPAVRRSCVRIIRNVLASITSLVGIRTPGGPTTDTMVLLPVPHLPNDSATSHIQGENVVGELSARVAHLLETCKHRGLFSSEEFRQRRTRACIETAASLVCCANAKVDWFGDLMKPLQDIGGDQTIQESTLAGKDQLFMMRWTCLSLIVIRPILEHNTWVSRAAEAAVTSLEREEDAGDGRVLPVVQNMEETFEKAQNYLNDLFFALGQEENLTEEKVKVILHDHEAQISALELISGQADRFEEVDGQILFVQNQIGIDSQGIITHQLPGVKFEQVNSYDEPVPFGQTIEWFSDSSNLLFILPRLTLKSFCSLGPTLRGILEGTWDGDAYQEVFKNLRAYFQVQPWQGNLLRQQLWRLQDLYDGGGLGLTIELFFFALKQLLSTSTSKESHSALYTGTFWNITSDWGKYRHASGTQNLLLDMVVPNFGITSEFKYPTYITQEFLVLLGNILEGQTLAGTHIDDVVQQLTAAPPFDPLTGLQTVEAQALEIITRARPPSS